MQLKLTGLPQEYKTGLVKAYQSEVHQVYPNRATDHVYLINPDPHKRKAAEFSESIF